MHKREQDAQHVPIPSSKSSRVGMAGRIHATAFSTSSQSDRNNDDEVKNKRERERERAHQTVAQ